MSRLVGLGFTIELRGGYRGSMSYFLDTGLNVYQGQFRTHILRSGPGEPPSELPVRNRLVFLRTSSLLRRCHSKLE